MCEWCRDAWVLSVIIDNLNGICMRIRTGKDLSEVEKDVE